MNYVLYGEESYLIQQKLKRIIEKTISFEKEMNTSVFDASKNSMEEIIADAQTIPFFSEQKVVVVYNANFLCASKDSDVNLEILDKYLDSPNDITTLVLICDHEKLDARKKITKRLIKEAKVLKFSFFNDFERNQFILSQSQKKNIHFTSDALKEFYLRVGHSPMRILNELDKLSLYHQKIEKQDVIAMITRLLDDNVFDLFQALIVGNFRKAYEFWVDFDSQNIEPIALISLLASQYRFLHQVSILRMTGNNKHEIAKILNAHPFRVEKTLDICTLCSEKEVAKTLNDLATLDQKIKMGKIDKKLGFELFLIEKGK